MSRSDWLLLFLVLLLFGAQHTRASTEEERLVKNLFKGYNKLIRPVRNASDYVVVTLDLFLLQLINVYEKEQIMKTNVWLTLKWQDFQLGWSSKDYKVGSIRVPYDRVWTPDIVLFNNADGNYETSYKPNVLLYADVDEKDQNINWIPPAIYQSSCTIDVRYFPFDEQSCQMRFGSWTFDAQQVRLKREKPMVNLQDYLPSGTWDVIDAPGEETYSKETNRMELVYHFRIRRKTLFYTVNLIIPTVLISFLSIFVFYLPTDEGEKMTLCISILLALVVFLLLVSKILPPTSMVIPLISKFLIFTLMMNIVTILNTVIIINWNYRTPRTHNMPKWVKLIFIEMLPKLLCMKRPDPERKAKKHRNRSVREFKYELPTGTTASAPDGGENGGGVTASPGSKLARNLSLELNENYPLGLKSPQFNKDGCGGGGGDANVNVDFIGAKAKINRQSSMNRTNTLDKSNPEGCSIFLSSSNTNEPQHQQHQTRPKQQQHKNLDKLFNQQQAMRSPVLSQLNNNNGLTSQQRKQRHFASMEQRNATTSRDCSLDENDFRGGGSTAASNRNRLMTLSGSESIGSNSQRFASLRSTSQMNPNKHQHHQQQYTQNMPPTSPDKHNHSDGGGYGSNNIYGDSSLRPGLIHRNVAGGGGGGGNSGDGTGSSSRRRHHRHHHNHHHNHPNLQQQSSYGLSQSLDYDTAVNGHATTSEDERSKPMRFDSDILDAAEKITYITNHIKNENDYEEIRDDWKYVALVIDRLQLYIFFSVTVIGTAYILFDAPHIFQFVDQQKVLRELIENNKF